MSISYLKPRNGAGSVDQFPVPAAPPDTSFSVAEANHRIANSLTVIAGLVQLQASDIARRRRDLSWREAQSVLDDVATRIKTVGQLHRLLSQDPSREAVVLTDYLREVCTALASSLSFSGTIDLVDDMSGTCLVGSQQALPVAVMVSELVTNSIKYAHPTGDDGRVRVGCSRLVDGSIEIAIADDGVGLPEGFDPATDGGLGLRVVRLLSAQLGGEATFRSSGLGLKVELLIPAGA